MTPEDVKELEPVENRFKHLTLCLEAAKVKGHVLELGVFGGGTANHMARCESGLIIHGFDSFKGLPERWERFEDDYSRPRGYYAVSETPKNLRPLVKLYRGWFKDTLPIWLKNFEGDIRLLHVDCDIYSSTKESLEILNERIVPGTVIAFDEILEFEELSFDYEKWAEGEWKALTEWLSEFNRDVKPLMRDNTARASFIVTK